MALVQNTDINSPAFGGIHEVTELGEHAPRRVQIRFGELDHQTISSDVASMMLTLWRERNPAWFGAVLAEAMTGEQPRAGRRRP